MVKEKKGFEFGVWKKMTKLKEADKNCLCWPNRREILLKGRQYDLVCSFKMILVPFAQTFCVSE